jgi:putative endonuclease
MATHLEIGKTGEKLAENYLVQNGYTILHRNWRCGGHEEIDLIATKNNMLHFVEVKYRSSTYGGHPEAAVNKQKTKILLRGIEQFLYTHKQYDDFRLDILAITQLPNRDAEYFFIGDVML